MKFKDAVEKAAGVHCRHAIAAAMSSEPGNRPAPDAPATVLCEEKVGQGMADDECDGNCPESVDKA